MYAFGSEKFNDLILGSQLFAILCGAGSVTIYGTGSNVKRRV